MPPYVKYYTPAEIKTFMGLVEAYILANLQIPHTRDSLGVHFQKEYPSLNANFIRLHFKEYFGMSISDYLKDQRLKKGKELLSDNTLTSRVIAPRIGMEPTTFSTAFRKKFGYTPTKYRNSLSQTNNSATETP